MWSIDSLQYSEHMFVSANEISSIMHKLKCGKSAGADGLAAEHFVHAHDSLAVHLSLCINSCLVHSFLPKELMLTLIVPLVKKQAGDISSVNNYRPIALCTMASKVLETVLLHTIDTYLTVEDNQFGFRKGLSTDMCIYTFKQIIEYYCNHSSPAYICYLDASKAFDRVNHWKLFKKLLDRVMDCDQYVRFAAVSDMKGNTIESKTKQGISNFLPAQEMDSSIKRAVDSSLIL